MLPSFMLTEPSVISLISQSIFSTYRENSMNLCPLNIQESRGGILGTVKAGRFGVVCFIEHLLSGLIVTAFEMVKVTKDV